MHYRNLGSEYVSPLLSSTILCEIGKMFCLKILLMLNLIFSHSWCIVSKNSGVFFFEIIWAYHSFGKLLQHIYFHYPRHI